MKDHLLEKAKGDLRQYQDKNKQILKRLFLEGQDPNVLCITCSDSRVMPEQMLGLDPGEYFLVRNVGNIIPSSDKLDANITAALEFSIFMVGVTDIVVCGHTDCGGLKGITEGIDDPRLSSLKEWLSFSNSSGQGIDSIIQNQPPINSNLTKVGAHVLQQLKNLKTYPFIMAQVEAGAVILHGWIYDIEESLMYYHDGDLGTFEVI